MNGYPPETVRSVSAPVRHGVVSVVVALLIADALLLAGNLLFLTADEPREPTHPVFSDLRFNGDNDGSFPEMFGYLLMLANTVLLTVMWRRRCAVFGALGLTVLVILADDVLMLHERAGEALVAVSSDFDAAGLGPQDVGEALFWAVAVLVLAPLLVAIYRRADPPDRRRARVVVPFLGALAFFAVVVDALHSALIPLVSSFVITGITLLETFGELGAMTALTIVLVRMVAGTRSDRG